MYTKFLHCPARGRAKRSLNAGVFASAAGLQFSAAALAMLLVADRFFDDGSAWTDLATGQPARVRVMEAAKTGSSGYVWADRCASIAVLRHPLINPLLDYGSCDASHVFEAYAARPPVRTGGAARARLLKHAARFLESHGVVVPSSIAPLLMRQVVGGREPGGRPVGLVLRRRRALEAIVDVLDAQIPPGTVHVDVVGAPGSGLRTLRVLAAREARIRGYVPVSAALLGRLPSVAEFLPARHVCLLIEEFTAPDVLRVSATVIARLAAASARRHVVLQFRREVAGARSSPIVLDPFGAAAMTGMLFVDGELGPSPEELFAAAKTADGRPGIFLKTIGAAAFGAHEARHETAREAQAPYRAQSGTRPEGRVCDLTERTPESATPGFFLTSRPSGPAGTVGDVDRQASARRICRAGSLAKAGRHAAACRLLARSARVLEARGATVSAAQCMRALGWIVRARGQSDRALECFERCSVLAPGSLLAIEGVVGRGVVHTDEARLVQAEATLRGARVASQSLGESSSERAASLALARALMWQGKYDEASSTLTMLQCPGDDTHVQVEVSALAARVHLFEGELKLATEAARRALDGATVHDDSRLIATAHRAMAMVLVALGDPVAAHEHVQRGLSAARAAHLPLLALRLRLVMPAPGHGAGNRRIRAGYYLRGNRLPQLLDARANAAAGADVSRIVRDTGACALSASLAQQRPAARLETLLEMSQAAPDDHAALDRICNYVCTELRAATAIVAAANTHRRILASVGKPWLGDAAICAQAMAAGRGVSPDPDRQPQQAAEPVRYGGLIVAALACRWNGGTEVNHTIVNEVLRAGALAAAGSVRAVLDDAAPCAGADAVSHDLLGDSAPAVALREAIARAARAPFPVLIEGESGSGKELVARAIHRLSTRRDRRWCAVNCAAIADDLLEAELFGHARGAFTGATSERAGLFEEADGGTLFLDEVADLSARAQAKLLRVLQDGEVRRVGENLPRRVDARVVAATNHRLDDDVSGGRFRADLRFRLDVIRIVVPSLRERVADIPLLAMHFWRAASAQVQSCATLAPETLSALARCDWPGNVRELQNAIAWMAVHSPRRGRVGPSALPARLAQAAAPSAGTFEVAREEFERRFVRAALARAGGHRSRAADAMGVSRQGLAKMLRRLNIDTT